MSSHVPASNNGSASFAQPGSMPDVKNDTPPSAQASSNGVRIDGSRCGGKIAATTELDTTFLPDRNSRAISVIASIGRRSAVAVYETQSASSASSASASLVASTPVGGRPHNSPASFPALSAECTHTPTSSSSGWPMMQRSAAVPTLPVLHWMTR